MKRRLLYFAVSASVFLVAWLGMRALFEHFNRQMDQPARIFTPLSEEQGKPLKPYVEESDTPQQAPSAITDPSATPPRTKVKKPTASPIRLAEERLLLHTVAGDILLALYPDVAPETVKQFLQWARLGVFDNTHYSRVEPNFVLQTSLAGDRLVPFTGEQKKSIRHLPGEFSKTLKHERGVISMGREDGQPDSAETSYSILLGNAPHLDGKYTIFGCVEAGMDVVDRLVQAGHSEGSNQPSVRLSILRVDVVHQDEIASLELEPALPAMQVQQGGIPARAVTATATSILKQHCWKCHGGDTVKGGLDMTNRASFLTGGEHGSVFTPREIEKSEILRRLNVEGEERMPPKGKGLEAYEKMILARWLTQGAPFPPDYALRQQGGRPQHDYASLIAKHWAYQPMKKPVPPKTVEKTWAKNEIDAFIFAALEAKKLSPNPAASVRTLQRRLSYDLIGLPVEAEHANEKYASAIDRLLASKHYGEQMARHWLDLVRFAESDGYEDDKNRPLAYQYRDFVIRAFNDDMPFDQFLRWQIAGDELAPQKPDALAATGYLAAGPFQTFFAKKKDRYDELDDIVSTTSVAFMGMTVGCARCHDHKHDPISQHDYYRLVSVFHGSHRGEDYLDAKAGQEYQKQREPLDALIKEFDQLTAPARAAVRGKKIELLEIQPHEKEALRLPHDPNNSLQASLLGRFDNQIQVTNDDARGECDEALGERWDNLNDRIKQMEQALPPAPARGLIYQGSQVIPAPFLERGDPLREKSLVPPAFVTAITPGQPVWQKETWKAWGHSPRSAFAYWLTDVDAGAGQLVARVIVNRLWQQHFGEGLVKTANDFGISGLPPSHPELLDWLAQELIRSGWKIKHLHRLIVSSATYQVSAGQNEALQQADPDNRLFGRRTLRRLSAEELRDSILVVSGQLNRTQFGPSIKPAIPQEAIFLTAPKHGEVWPLQAPEQPANWRRSLYIYTKRSNPVPFLQLFDAPDAAASCASRIQSTTPTQALALINDNFIRYQASLLAESLQASGQTGRENMVREAYLRILGRIPSTLEQQKSLAFMEEQMKGQVTVTLQQALTDFCHVLMMTNEFLYVE